MPQPRTAVRCPFCDTSVGDPQGYDGTDPSAVAEARLAAEDHLHDHVAEIIEEVGG